jgi:hypothetical protein
MAAVEAMAKPPMNGMRDDLFQDPAAPTHVSV